MGKVSETADDPLFETQLRIHFATFPYSIDIQINMNIHTRLDGGDVLTTSKLGAVMSVNISGENLLKNQLPSDYD